MPRLLGVRVYLLSILGGLALAPVGVAFTIVLIYILLWLQGMKEDQGRRGLLAGCFGTIFGSAFGFYGGFQLAWWFAGGAGTRPAWGAAGLGALLGWLGATALGLPGWYFGILLAEHRGVSNYAGERAVWGFLWVALPLAVVGGLAGFLGGWSLAIG